MKIPAKYATRFVSVLLALFCLAVPALGSSHRNGNQNQASADAPQGTEYSLSVEAPLVMVDVLVTDEDGTVLSGLRKENFRILDNGKPQVISDFASTNAPITIVILMEYSGIAYDYFAYKAAYWGTEFLDHLELDDWVALVTYDIKPTVKVDFTKSKPAIEQALKNLYYPEFREANMFDAIADTLDRLAEVKGKKSILLITSGADTFSSTTLDELYDKLKGTDATIFCIGIAEQEYMMAEMRSGVSYIGYLQMKNQLQTFATRTGGFAWFPRFEGELPDLFRSVGGTLRSQYALSFSPPKESRDGRYHKLKVEVIGNDGLPLKVRNEKDKYRKVTVFAREGYIAPSASPQD